MPPALLAVLTAFPSLFQSRASLQAEALSLRHQRLILERRRAGRRVPLRTSDRILWTCLSRTWPGWRQALEIEFGEDQQQKLKLQSIHGPQRISVSA